MGATKEQVIDLLKDRVRGGCRTLHFSDGKNAASYSERRCWDNQGNPTSHTMFKNNLIIGECKTFNGNGEVTERYYWVHDGTKKGQDTGYVDEMPIGLIREGFIYVEGKYYPD